MRKWFFCFLLIMGTLSVNGQIVVSENDTLILWKKERSLKWEDFQGEKVKPKSIYVVHQVAGTGTIIKYFYKLDKNGEPFPYPLCYFDKSRSWSISNDSEMLMHEQIHFDIEELFVRKIRKEFTKLKKEGVTDSHVYSEYASKMLDECSNVQDRYDNEVHFDIIKLKEWRTNIDKELETLKDFEFILD